MLRCGHAPLAPSAPDDAPTALINLLKYNISVKKAVVLLEDEIKSLNNYFVVQKYRYGDTFDARFELDPETLQCEVLLFYVAA